MPNKFEDITERPESVMGVEIDDSQWKVMKIKINTAISKFSFREYFGKENGMPPYNEDVNVYSFNEDGSYSKYSIYSDLPEEVLRDDKLRQEAVAKRVIESIEKGNVVMAASPYGEPYMIDFDGENFISTSVNPGPDYNLKNVQAPKLTDVEYRPPEEVPEPEEVKKPGLFTRMLNAITFGAYGKEKFERYNTYKKKIETYNEYCRKKDEYDKAYNKAYGNADKNLKKFANTGVNRARIENNMEKIRPVIANDMAMKEKYVQNYNEKWSLMQKENMIPFEGSTINGINERFDKAFGTQPFVIEGGLQEEYKSDVTYNIPEGMEDVWSGIILSTGFSKENASYIADEYKLGLNGQIDFYMNGNIIPDLIGKEKFGMRQTKIGEYLEVTKKNAEQVAKNISENNFENVGEMVNNAICAINGQLKNQEEYLDRSVSYGAFVRSLESCIHLSEKYPQIGEKINKEYLKEAKGTINIFNVVKKSKVSEKELTGKMTEPGSEERKNLLLDSLVGDYVQKKINMHYKLNLEHIREEQYIRSMTDAAEKRVGSDALSSEYITMAYRESKCSELQMNFGEKPDEMIKGIREIIEHSNAFKELMEMDLVDFGFSVCSDIARKGRFDNVVNNIIKEEREMIKDAVRTKNKENEVSNVKRNTYENQKENTAGGMVK